MSEENKLLIGSRPLYVYMNDEGVEAMIWRPNFSFSPLESSRQKKLLSQLKKEVHEYLLGKRKVFSVPLNPKGTPFQHMVWKRLLEIPWGETRSYKDLAIKLGDSKKSRAVARACATNPISLLVPCHRVINSQGGLSGYAGGVDVKKHLLSLEGGNFPFNEL